jgi:hypothetical protein
MPGVNPSVFASSSMTGVTILGTSSSVTNSTIGSTTLTDVTITDNIIYSGTVLLPNGSSTIITVPTSVHLVINSAPVVATVISVAGGTITLIDTSTDPNATSSAYLTDSWVYTINYGDGTVSTSSASSLGSTFNHTYLVSGTYTVSVVVTDAYGVSSTSTSQVSVTVPVVASGGSSFTSGGGYYYTTSLSSLSTVSATTTDKVNQDISASSTTFIFTRTLSVGMSGDAVSALQRILKYYGFYVYPEITGYFGPITQNAVVSFQKVRGLAPYPGIVGPRTRAELHKVQGISIPVSFSNKSFIKKIAQPTQTISEKVLGVKKENDSISLIRAFIFKIKSTFQSH